jgi:hypothetical protein
MPPARERWRYMGGHLTFISRDKRRRLITNLPKTRGPNRLRSSMSKKLHFHAASFVKHDWKAKTQTRAQPMGNKKKPGLKKKAARPDDLSAPAYLLEISESDEKALDFNELTHEFDRTLDLLEPILIPTQEDIDRMSVLVSLGLKDDHFWWYFVYAKSDSYRELVEEYNQSRAAAGLLIPDQQAPELKNSHVAVIRRGMSEKRISTGFLKSWGALEMLSGLYCALVQLGKSEEQESRRKFKAGLTDSRIGHQVWYARWLLANTKDVKKDRGTAEGKLAKICAGMVKGRRQLAGEGPWDSHWFGKLLGASGVDLKDRLTRLSETKIRRLADHGRITADLLPPLNESAFIVATPRGGVTSSKK